MLLLTNQNHVLPFPIPESIINPNDLIGWCVTKDFRDEGAGVHNGAIAKCEFEGDGGLHWFDVFYAGDDDEESFDSNDITTAYLRIRFLPILKRNTTIGRRILEIAHDLSSFSFINYSVKDQLFRHFPFTDNSTSH